MTANWQRATQAVVVLLLLATAYNGIFEGLNAARHASTLGQRVATVTQLAYGVLAIAAIVAVAIRHRITLALLVGWAAALVATAALAPIVYGGASVVVAAVAVILVALVTGSVIVAWRRANPPTNTRLVRPL